MFLVSEARRPPLRHAILHPARRGLPKSHIYRDPDLPGKTSADCSFTSAFVVQALKDIEPRVIQFPAGGDWLFASPVQLGPLGAYLGLIRRYRECSAERHNPWLGWQTTNSFTSHPILLGVLYVAVAPTPYRVSRFTPSWIARSGSAESGPSTPLVQHTDGLFYGFTVTGGTPGYCNSGDGCGVLYSLDMGLGAFAQLQTTSGKEGATVGILGQGFSKSSVVEFGGTAATKVTLSGTTYLTATVPSDALTGPVTVTTGSTTLTSSQNFSVLPTAKTFTPTSGPVGTLVTITGTGLTQTSLVEFNGKSAAFTVVSDTEITATVPTGATTGKIGITTKGGTVETSSKFTVN